MLETALAYSWHDRVIAYALVLVTDQYPPFRLAPWPAARGSNSKLKRVLL